MCDREFYDRLALALQGQIPELEGEHKVANIILIARAIARVLKERDEKFKPDAFVEQVLENV